MATELTGKRIAFIATNGVEQRELSVPWDAARAAGASPELISTDLREIQGVIHGTSGTTFHVDRTFDDASPETYDALIIPGGVANPDRLRMDERAVRFVRHFVDAGKPIAAICHGPWLLVEADAVRDRTVTSWPSLRTDLRNAGATWVDEEVVVDDGLVTSRKPDDLPAFCAALVREFAGVREHADARSPVGSGSGRS